MARTPFLRAEPDSSAPALRAALDRALTFDLSAHAPPPPTAEQLHNWAQAEAAQPSIAIDGSGLTTGMQRHLLAAWLAPLAAWRAARAEFDRLLEPHMADIRAVEHAGAQLQETDDANHWSRAEALHGVTRQQAYIEAERRHQEAEHRFTVLRQAHGNREATMAAYNPLYWLGLALIGVAEWQINYRTFLAFLNIPAIAAGTTAVLGAVLAFAAHAHGTLLKQWQFRFGPHRDDHERFSPWQYFALATVALIVVVTAAGASRYSVALSGMSASAVVPDITGAAAITTTNPLRDVLISLLGNIGAWLAGVFLAYLCHDVDDDFMRATRQYQRAERRYRRARAPLEKLWRIADARHQADRATIQTTATVRREAVHTELALLAQMRRQEHAVLAACTAAATPPLEAYRDQLCTLAEVRGTALTTADSSLTPHQYRLLRPEIAERLAEALQ